MNILYATDGSVGAAAGALVLSELRLGAADTIRVLTVVGLDETPAAADSALGDARGALDGLAAELRTEVRRAGSSGHVLEEILRAAESERTDLVVVGTSGRAPLARFFLGSVAARIARYTPCPVLLARPPKGRLDRVLVGVDGSDYAAYAAHWLKSFPLPDECAVRLATMVTPVSSVYQRFLLPGFVTDHLRGVIHEEREEAEQRIKQLARELPRDRWHVSSEIRSAEPVAGVLDAADAFGADLVVLGAQGLGGMDRFLLGSVTEKVLRHAPCSVLVVRQGSAVVAQDRYPRELAA